MFHRQFENQPKIHRKSIENLWKIYRKSMENLWKIYRKSTENLQNLRKSMKNAIFGKKNVMLTKKTFYVTRNTLPWSQKFFFSRFLWKNVILPKKKTCVTRTELPRKSIENLLMSIDADGFPGISIDIYGYPMNVENPKTANPACIENRTLGGVNRTVRTRCSWPRCPIPGF